MGQVRGKMSHIVLDVARTTREDAMDSLSLLDPLISACV